MSKIILTLSSNYVRNWTFKDAIRELFQNAIDQETENPDDKMNFGFYGVGRERASLTIANTLSHLDKSTLILGNTTKTSSELIGKFGEGYKLALIVLLRMGCKVNIYNGNELWIPSLQYVHEYKSKLLTIDIRRRMNQGEHNLRFEITDIPFTALKEWREYNLVSNVNYSKMVIDKREVLTDDKHRGLIFVRGLFICKSPVELTYGYNLQPGDIELDRDRSMVNSFNLTWFLSSMWAKSKRYDLVTDMIFKRANDTEYLMHQGTSVDLVSTACEKFKDMYGDAMPVSSQAHIDTLRTQGYTGKTAIVSSVLYDVIKSKFTFTPTYTTPYELIGRFIDDHKDNMDEAMHRDIMVIYEKSKEW